MSFFQRPFLLPRLCLYGVCLASLCGAFLPSRAEIVQGGRDTSGNLDNSGTNKNPPPNGLDAYVGDWGGSLGIPISPHYFVTAAHVSGGSTFKFANGTGTKTSYTVALAAKQDDLAVWKITDTGAFSLYAPLYKSSDELSQPIVSIGNGTTRGVAITGGWAWTTKLTSHSWQTNTVGDLYTTPGVAHDSDLILYFDRKLDSLGNLLNPDTGIFSGNDSGGPTFVLDPTSNTYKLGGVNSGVAEVATTSNGSPTGLALFDARGYYDIDPITNKYTVLISDPNPVPLYSFASRISSHLDFLKTTLGSEYPADIGTPVANAQSVNTGFNTPTTITLTGSDPDVPALPLTYAVVNPSHGTLSGTAPNLTYTPNAGYHGADNFTFTVNNGTYTSLPATISLSVATGTPTATSQSVNAAFNTTKAVTLTGSDPDVPALPLTYAVASPSHGTLSGTAPRLTYRPTTGYHGTDSFTFTVNNGTNTSATGTVSITVATGTPTATSQSVNAAFNTTKAITLTGRDPDVPALPLTYAVANPSHGTLSGTAPNLTYTPTAGYHGTDSFTFTVNNGTYTSATGTVSITVATGKPTATSQSVTTNRDTPLSITLTGSDPNIPALPLTYAVTNPAHGTLSGTVPNLTYTPTAGYHGTDSFTFTVNNGTYTSAKGTVSIAVK